MTCPYCGSDRWAYSDANPRTKDDPMHSEYVHIFRHAECFNCKQGFVLEDVCEYREHLIHKNMNDAIRCFYAQSSISGVKTPQKAFTITIEGDY